MIKLSVVVITFNEERNIARCLESVKEIADEMVVVDSISTDQTKAICLKYGVRFIEQPFLGYIEQKNFALKFATHDHVLSLDADEALSPELINSIQETKRSFSATGYTMNRFTNYCGKWIRHCGWYPDTKLRLFDHTKGKWGGINPHDQFFLEDGSTIKHLKGDILHYSYYTRDDHFKQIERFTNIAAQAYYDSGKKPSCLKMWLSPLSKFIRDFFFNLGLLDGRAGFEICTLSAKATYLKYRKLSKLYRERKPLDKKEHQR